MVGQSHGLHFVNHHNCMHEFLKRVKAASLVTFTGQYSNKARSFELKFEFGKNKIFWFAVRTFPRHDHLVPLVVHNITIDKEIRKLV